VPVLRWPAWHEGRGNMYALALSPDRESRYVAVAGQGLTVGAVAVLDRLQGTIKHITTRLPKGKHGTNWAIAYAPSGKQVAYGSQFGMIWVWDLADGAPAEPRLLGRHDGPEYTYVRAMHYLDEHHLLSVAETGQVLLWDVPGPDAKAARRELFRFKTNV